MSEQRELPSTLGRYCQRYVLAATLLLALGWMALSGCGQQEPEQLFASAEAAATDPKRLAEAAEQFAAFLAAYPDHDRASEAVKYLAQISQQQGNMEEAIGHYQSLLANYPDSAERAEAQFMIAFIYEEYLEDLDGARAAYQKVIDQYPESELAISAQRLLPHVGLDPEEWVEFKDEAGPP